MSCKGAILYCRKATFTSLVVTAYKTWPRCTKLRAGFPPKINLPLTVMGD